MEKIKAPRGTQDICGFDSKLWQYIEFTALQVLQNAGYEEIRVPIFESTELFKRAVGEGSDIVNKEMYTFQDKGDRSMTLRPEGTAGVIRSYIENSMSRGQKPVKLWYRGPMFRYERPQTGRFRQFHQIGVEAIGSSNHYVDLELIFLAWLTVNLFLPKSNLKLYINSLGSAESRDKYRDALKEFLKPLQGKVCEDCQRRFEDNPLRALDCKVPEDQKLYENAPAIIDYLDDESKKFWEEISRGLDELKIQYEIDPRLVRGLDYYNHIVFEIKADDPSLGQQSTILAGGRYDGLISQLGGQAEPAVGWALGIERIAILISEKLGDREFRSGAYIVCDDIDEALKLALEIRSQGLKVQYDFESTKTGKQIDKANKKGARFAIFYLEEERKSSKFKVKDLETGEEQEGLEFPQLLQLLASETMQNPAQMAANK